MTRAFETLTTGSRRDFTVRRAAPDDVTVLSRLCAEHAAFERATFESDGQSARLRAALFDGAPTLWAWVATRYEEAVGYATANEEFSTWRAAPFLHLDCLFVRTECRGVGIGAALLDAVIAHARTRDLHEVQWQTPAWNTDAQRFYRRQGATSVEKARFSLSLPEARR